MFASLAWYDSKSIVQSVWNYVMFLSKAINLFQFAKMSSIMSKMECKIRERKKNGVCKCQYTHILSRFFFLDSYSPSVAKLIYGFWWVHIDSIFRPINLWFSCNWAALFSMNGKNNMKLNGTDKWFYYRFIFDTMARLDIN